MENAFCSTSEATERNPVKSNCLSHSKEYISTAEISFIFFLIHAVLLLVYLQKHFMYPTKRIKIVHTTQRGRVFWGRAVCSIQTTPPKFLQDSEEIHFLP